MVDTVKSSSITNLDNAGNSPPAAVQYASAGDGARGYATVVSDSCAATTGGLGSTSSTYKMVRLPSNVFLKNIKLITSATLDTNVSPTLTFDVGAYYSDATLDGTAVANQGVLIDADCFAAAVVSPLVGVPTSVTWANESLTATPFMNAPLWAMTGLATDPGGFIDIVLAVHAAAATAAAGSIWLEASYTK